MKIWELVLIVIGSTLLGTLIWYGIINPLMDLAFAGLGR